MIWLEENVDPDFFFLVILDVALVVRSGGLRVLIQALIDGQHGISEVLIQSVLYVLDTPDKRRYLRPGVELETIIAPFTESNKGTNHEEKIKNSAKMVITLIKSWAGIFYMSANNMRAARSVVQALRMPVPETQVTFLFGTFPRKKIDLVFRDWYWICFLMYFESSYLKIIMGFYPAGNIQFKLLLPPAQTLQRLPFAQDIPLS